MPRRARLYGASELSSRPSRRTEPPAGLSRPQTALKSVVLPAPFGPMRPVTKPGVGVDVDVVEREVAAEAHGDPAALEERHVSAPRARPSRASSSATSSGVNGRSMPTHSSGTSANSTPAAASVSGAGWARSPATSVKPISATTPPTTNHHAPMSATSTIAYSAASDDEEQRELDLALRERLEALADVGDRAVRVAAEADAHEARA